jgi:predicted phosphodiesterase
LPIDSVSAVAASNLRVAVLPDIHIPYHDEALLERAMVIARGAAHIIIIGDLIDCYTISSFDKDPQRKHSLQDECDTAKLFLGRLRDENPDARIDLIEGNHEDRVRRFVWGKAPALSDWRSLTIPVALGLDAAGITYHPRSGFTAYGWRFKHGDVVSKGSGVTARAEMTAHRCSGVSGHTHRLGHATMMDKEGVRTDWWEAGHLCKVSDAEYANAPDWQAGMLLLHVANDSVTSVEPIRFEQC